jgi:mRNA interferase YafQ
MPRTIEWTTAFKRDRKRELKGQYGKTLETMLTPILESLVADKPLAFRYRDHDMHGDWVDHRNCHVRPDLVLLYRKEGDDVLQLVRLGSHSELGI